MKNEYLLKSHGTFFNSIIFSYKGMAENGRSVHWYREERNIQ